MEKVQNTIGTKVVVGLEQMSVNLRGTPVFHRISRLFPWALVDQDKRLALEGLASDSYLHWMAYL